MNITRTKLLSSIALAGAASLALGGCASNSSNAAADGPADRAIEIAVFNGWDEGIAASYLWQAILESKGYDVELTYADVAPVYQGLAGGDFGCPRRTPTTWRPTATTSKTSARGMTRRA